MKMEIIRDIASGKNMIDKSFTDQKCKNVLQGNKPRKFSKCASKMSWYFLNIFQLLVLHTMLNLLKVRKISKISTC